MKIFVGLRVRKNYGDYSVINEFRELFPFGIKGSGFAVRLPPDDPHLQQILAAAKAKGIPKVDYSKNPRPQHEYVLEYLRSYDPEDFDSAAYLKFGCNVLVTESPKRDEEGRLLLNSRELRPSLRMGCAVFQSTVISDVIRQEMLKAGLIGVQFKEVMCAGRVSDKFWELTSSVLLPPMPRERLIPNARTPEDYVHVIGFLDGEFQDKELHYRADEIKKIEPFDFGLTVEYFGRERLPIASQKFRQFCIAQKLKASWVPVRVDVR